MRRRGVVLSAVARVLNAGGSALVDVYDAVASLKTNKLPRGEKATIATRIRERERHLERLYIDFSKDAPPHEPTGQISAAREAANERAAEHRAEIASLRQRLRDIDGECKATSLER